MKEFKIWLFREVVEKIRKALLEKEVTGHRPGDMFWIFFRNAFPFSSSSVKRKTASLPAPILALVCLNAQDSSRLDQNLWISDDHQVLPSLKLFLSCLSGEACPCAQRQENNASQQKQGEKASIFAVQKILLYFNNIILNLRE